MVGESSVTPTAVTDGPWVKAGRITENKKRKERKKGQEKGLVAAMFPGEPNVPPTGFEQEGSRWKSVSNRETAQTSNKVKVVLLRKANHKIPTV